MKINRASVFYTAMVLAFSSVILQAIGFIYRIYLTELAGTEALGIYKLVMQFYMVLLAVTTSGANLVSTNRSSALYSLGDVAKLKKTVRSCLLLFLCLLSICFVFICLFDDFIAVKVLGDIDTKMALYVATACILLTGFENIIKNSLIGIKKVKYTAFSEIVEQIIRVCIVLWLLYNYADGDYGKIAVYIILGMTISEIFSVIFLGVTYEKIHKTSKKCSEKVFLSVAKVALPISLAAIVINVIASASTLILPSRLVAAGFTRSEALSELGIISGIANPILVFPIAIISSYCVVVMPNISKSYALGDYSNIVRKINKSFEATGLIGVPVTCLLVFLATPIARIFFATDFETKYIALIGVSVVFLYYQMMTSSILNGLSEERKVVFHNLIGESVQLAITFLLCSIPSINIYGYIYGLIASPLIVTLLNSSYIFENYKFNFRKFVINPVFCGLFMYASVSFLYEYIIGIIGSQLQTTFVVSVIGFLIYLLILRCFGINYIQYIKNLKIDRSFQFKLK